MKMYQLFLLSLLIFQMQTQDDDSYVFVTEPIETFNKNVALKDQGNVKFDDSIKGRRIVDEMGFGWNLGNTLDAWNSKQQDQGLISEMSWGVDLTTELLMRITQLTPNG